MTTEADGEDTFILACNLAQNVRAMGATYGLVDACRIGGDNGPIDIFPQRYMIGIKNGTPRYFMNGRVWYSDPDPVYVRDAVPLERARLFATWTSIGGMLYNFSDRLPDLSAERVEVLKRTMAPHGVKTVRPVDFFERTLANAWVLEKGDVRVFGLYNWSTNESLKIDYPAAYAGLDPNREYVGFDFWGGASSCLRSGARSRQSSNHVPAAPWHAFPWPTALWSCPRLGMSRARRSTFRAFRGMERACAASRRSSRATATSFGSTFRRGAACGAVQPMTARRRMSCVTGASQGCRSSPGRQDLSAGAALWRIHKTSAAAAKGCRRWGEAPFQCVHFDPLYMPGMLTIGGCWLSG